MILHQNNTLESRVQPPTQSWDNVKVQSGRSRPCPAEVCLLGWRDCHLSGCLFQCPTILTRNIFFPLLHIVKILLGKACVHCLLFLAVHLRRACFCVLPNQTSGSWGSWSDFSSPGSPNSGTLSFFCTLRASGLQPCQWFSAGLTSASQCFFLYWEAQKWTQYSRHGLTSAVKSRITTSFNLLVADAVQ